MKETGVWKCSINHFSIKGDVIFTVKKLPQNYYFKLAFAAGDFGEVKIVESSDADARVVGNELYAETKSDIYPEKNLKVKLNLNEDTGTGVLKMPFLGNMVLKNVACAG